jgi:hypothetical protein
MNGLRNAMNNRAAALNVQAQYHYSNVAPRVTGRHECVGVIYNDLKLTAGATGVGRNQANNTYLLPRTPFWVTFTVTATGNVFNLIGIHAPPPKGSVASYYVPPINFCALLANVAEINSVPVATGVLLGDFNCNPATSYVKYPPGNNYQPVNVFPFTGLVNYQPILPNAAVLTSVRQKVFNQFPPPGNYLKDAYDNIIYRPAATGVNASNALNLIGNAPAPLYQNNLRRLVSNYWKVSDHLPVMVIFT